MTDAPQLVPNGFYSMNDIARIVFGRDVRYLWRDRRFAKLKEAGFPKPVSPVGHPRWSGAALLAWANRPQADDCAAPLPEGAGNVTDITTILRRRALAIAGDGRKRA